MKDQPEPPDKTLLAFEVHQLLGHLIDGERGRTLARRELPEGHQELLRLNHRRHGHRRYLLAPPQVVAVGIGVGALIRVAAQVVDFRDMQSGFELTLELSRDEFADMLGVTRQSLNRELKALETLGLIAIAYSRINLHDVEQLRSMAALAE